MKKVFAYLLIVAILGSIFGLVIQTNNKKDTPVIGSVLEFVAPTIVYADSDTFGGISPPQPPPPIPK